MTRDGPRFVGLKSTRVAAAEEVAPLLAAAQRVRSTASTKMNDRSSRSHYVFRMRIRRREGEGVGRRATRLSRAASLPTGMSSDHRRGRRVPRVGALPC